MNNSFAIAKTYLMALLDLLLFSMAAWEGLDHVLRTIAAVGAIIVLYFTIRKAKKDIELKKAQLKQEEIEQAIREQELFRLMEVTKNKNQ